MAFVIRSRGGERPHLPEQLLDGVNTTIDLEMLTDPPRGRRTDMDMWDPGREELCGYFIPDFQRPLVWTETQKERFIESALLGLSLGTIVVVDAMNLPMQSPNRFARLDRVLLDGQQRLSAITDYRNDRLVALRGTECEHRWSDLSVVERRGVGRIQMGLIKIATDDETVARAIYDRLNFGGTAHLESQRASLA